MDSQQGPSIGTWNPVQFYVATWMGGEFGREWIHVLDGYIYGYKWMNTYMYG